MKLSSLRVEETASLSFRTLDAAGASGRPPQPGLSAFQFGCLTALADVGATILAGQLLHSVLLPGKAWGWPEVAFVLLVSGMVGLSGARHCDSDPEAMIEAISRPREASAALMVIASALGSLCMFGWLGRADTGRELLWAAAFLLAARLVLWAVALGARRATRLIRPLRLALVDASGPQRDGQSRITLRANPLYRIVSFIDLNSGSRSAALGSSPAPSIELLISLIRGDAVDAVLIDPAGLRPAHLAGLLDRIAETPAEVRLVCRPMAGSRPEGQVLSGGGVPQRRIRLRCLPGWAAVAKRAEDLVLGLALLILLAPTMALIAIAVKLDSPGPVLFRQPRYGRNNRVIEVLKFRTMRHDRGDVAGALQALPGDDRVTRVGRLLRRLSLDELPQLLNVIDGSMSLVGPRPHALETRVAGVLFEDAVVNYPARHNVKPGITGLAQIRGWRGPTTSQTHLEHRVQADFEYIRCWSLGLDLLIVLRTVPAMLLARNAC